jgi:RimJ/RimL family protein N-acetyltransferase
MIHGTLTNLRAVDRSDLDRIHTWLDDPELMRTWGYGAPALSRTNAAGRLEEWLADEFQWDHPVAFIVETLEGGACGLLILSRLSPVDRSCELSLFLEPAARNQGIGADVVETIADAAFSQWNVHRLMVQSEAHNTAAHAFFTRQGFVQEGRLREARYLDGEWHDILIFGRLRSDQEVGA